MKINSTLSFLHLWEMFDMVGTSREKNLDIASMTRAQGFAPS